MNTFKRVKHSHNKTKKVYETVKDILRLTRYGKIKSLKPLNR